MYFLRHNLNASDALYLRQILDWQTRHEMTSDHIILVAADLRFLRAAEREGLATLNPELAEEAEVEKLIAG